MKILVTGAAGFLGSHLTEKLVEKYNDLAREALSKGDKILSENYFQHADPFSRILSERDKVSSDSRPKREW